MLPYTYYEQKLMDLIRRQSITTTLGAVQNQRIVLGGIRSSGGGGGGPIQPFIGKLTQTNVTFDTDEYAVITIPSGEQASLLDNLNRIRFGETILPSGGDWFPVNYTVPSGSNLNTHLAAIDTYLGNLSTSELQLFLYASGDAHVPTYFQMRTAPSQNVTYTFDHDNVVDEQVLDVFITDSGTPGWTFFPEGLVHVHFHARKNVGVRNATLRVDGYKRDSSDVETFIASTEDTPELTSTMTEYELRAAVEEGDLDITDRFVAKIVVSVTGLGAAPDIEYEVEGDTFSRIDFPASAAQAGAAGHTIQDEGIELAARAYLNFVGAGVTATDSAGVTVVTIPGGGASGGWPFAKVLTVDPTDLEADYTNIFDAVSAAGPGYTIQLGPATYNESFTVPAGVALQAVSRDTVTISGNIILSSGVYIQDVTIMGSGTVITVPAGTNAELHNVYLTLIGSGYGVDVQAGSTLKVRDGEYVATIGAASVPGDEELNPDLDFFMQDNAGPDQRNYGATQAHGLGYISGQGQRRMIMHFDLSGVTNEILSAELDLYNTVASGTSGVDIRMDIYRILVANDGFIEGSSHDAIEVGAPCWDYLDYFATQWAGGASAGCGVAGTDYDSTTLGFLDQAWDVGGSDGYNTFTLSATEIEKLRDGTYTNVGLLVKPEFLLSNSTAQISSRDDVPAKRPILRLGFGSSPGPSTPGQLFRINGAAELDDPIIRGGIIGTGTYEGFFYDTNMTLRSGQDGVVELDERATPSTPDTGRWKFYFKSDGLYILQDDGTETGPLGTGGGGGVTFDEFKVWGW
jgi:hypothetical protein